MRKKSIVKNWILFLIAIAFFGCNSNEIEKETVEKFPVLKGKYLGQKEPGLKPEIFAPNIISTGMAEINAAFSPNFEEFYYSIRMPNGQLVIMQMNYDGEKWSEPEVASFSGEYSDADPFITYDGRWLYYISKRPINSSAEARKDWDIWRVRKDEGNWSKPERLSAEINSEANETYPSLTKEGKLYFATKRNGQNNSDIYYAESFEGGFNKPVRLSDTVNSHYEGDIFISANEDYMIFSSYGRDSGPGLYITFRNNGHWSLPQRMSEDINMTGREFCPIASPDGKYFFFTSNQVVELDNDLQELTYEKIKDNFIQSYNYPQRGKTDIYWVNAEVVEDYRKKQ